MNELRSALELTVVGMGMTFLSIGALALGMFLMTTLLRGKDKTPLPEVGREEEELTMGKEIQSNQGGERPSADARRRAAAAAVAVAMALRESEPRQRTEEPGRYSPAHEAWNGFARSRHLSVRLLYEARRRHR